MAKSILDIIINTIKKGTGNTETVKELVSLKTTIMNTAAATGALVAGGLAVKKMMDESVGVFVAYADQVRRTQDATGLTAEESSKLIQVLDDEKIAYEQLEKVIATNGKAYDFSIDGLARMSEQYLKLETAQEKASFMQERFGKQWISFVPVMEKGEDAIRAASDSISGSLVLTQEGVDKAREYEIALDDWNDAVLGLKVSIGNELLPILVDLMNSDFDKAMERGAKATGVAGLAVQTMGQDVNFMTAQLERGRAMTDFYNAQLAGTSEVIDGQVLPSLEELSKANAAIIKDAIAITDSNKEYQKSQDEILEQIAELRAQKEELYPWEIEKSNELQGKIDELNEKYSESAAAFEEATTRKLVMMSIEKIAMLDGVAGFSEAEAEKALLLAETAGVAEAAAIRQSVAFDQVSTAIATGTIKAKDMDTALKLMTSGYSIDVVINAISNLTGAAAAVTASGSANYVQQLRSGYAAGGISTGPTSGHMELLHGTEAVIPLQNGAVPVQMMMPPGNASMSGGGNIYVTMTIASPMTVLNEQTARNTLLPYIIDGIRQAQAQGSIR